MRRYVAKSPPSKLAASKRFGAKKRLDPVFIAKHKLYMKEYRRLNRAAMAEKDRRYNKENAVEIRLRRKGLDPAKYQAHVENREMGACDLCGGKPDGQWKKLNIDHCHVTGGFRGLLCFACNRGLGLFRDNSKLLRKAADYLDAYHKTIPNESDILGVPR